MYRCCKVRPINLDPCRLKVKVFIISDSRAKLLGGWGTVLAVETSRGEGQRLCGASCSCRRWRFEKTILTNVFIQWPVFSSELLWNLYRNFVQVHWCLTRTCLYSARQYVSFGCATGWHMFQPPVWSSAAALWWYHCRSLAIGTRSHWRSICKTSFYMTGCGF